jgi:hypothetical protein
LPRRGVRFLYKRSQMLRAVEFVRKLRNARRLIFGDPVFARLWQSVRSDPNLRKIQGRYPWLKELLRLALLREATHGGPAVRRPCWVSIQFDPDAGRLTFTSKKVSDLPYGIASGSPILERARAAVRAHALREIIWDFAQAGPDLWIGQGKRGEKSKLEYFHLGAASCFRFTGLEKVADLDSELADQVLVHVGESAWTVNADAVRPPVVGDLRRAS